MFGDVVVVIIAVASVLSVLAAITWWFEAVILDAQVGLGEQLRRWLASGAVAPSALVAGILADLPAEASVSVAGAAGAFGPSLIMGLRPGARAARRRHRERKVQRLRLEEDRQAWVQGRIARGEPLSPAEERWMHANAPELDPELLAAEQSVRRAPPTSWEIWRAKAELRRQAEEPD